MRLVFSIAILFNNLLVPSWNVPVVTAETVRGDANRELQLGGGMGMVGDVGGFFNLQQEDQGIVGGDYAQPGIYAAFGQYGPWPSSNLCGSVLVAPDLLISAAHCGEPFSCQIYMSGQTVKINAGEPYDVKRFVTHADYDNIFGVRQDNDIMALQLFDPVEGILPVAYNRDPFLPVSGATVTTIGFGTTTSGAPAASALQEVVINVQNYSTCSQYYPGLQPNIHLCASDVDKDSCQGDSGGPLFANFGEGTGTLVGLVSFGNGCGQEDPGVYTRISAYAEWIDEAICCLSDYAEPGCYCGEDWNETEADCEMPPSPCFSADATATVQDKGKVPMRDLNVGDHVLTASGQYEPVYTINHFHPSKATNFLRIHTDLVGDEKEMPLELSPLHLVYIQGKKDPVPAKDVQVGDYLQTLNYGPRKVTDIQSITKNGLYNPITKDGTMIVDGIIASSYTSFTGSAHLEIAGMNIMSVHDLLHMSIAPYRAFCMATSSLNICNQHVAGELPTIVQKLSDFYDFASEQNDPVQYAIITTYISFFTVTNLFLSEYSILILAAVAGWFCTTRRSSISRSARSGNSKECQRA